MNEVVLKPGLIANLSSASFQVAHVFQTPSMSCPKASVRVMADRLHHFELEQGKKFSFDGQTWKLTEVTILGKFDWKVVLSQVTNPH